MPMTTKNSIINLFAVQEEQVKMAEALEFMNTPKRTLEPHGSCLSVSITGPSYNIDHGKSSSRIQVRVGAFENHAAGKTFLDAANGAS